MTPHAHDIEAMFAAFGIPCFPYRTFPPAEDARQGAALRDRRRERPRADVRRPEGSAPREPLRRAAEEGAGGDVRALAQPASPRP